MEMQRLEQHRRMLDARMKSALIAPDSQNSAAAQPPGMEDPGPPLPPGGKRSAQTGDVGGTPDAQGWQSVQRADLDQAAKTAGTRPHA